MTVPKKGDIIVNPNTNRPVRVGSATWLRLVKTGVVDGHYTDPRELAKIEPDEDLASVEQKINEVNKTLPMNKQACRGRGMLKGKIVARTKTPSAQEIARYNAKIGSAPNNISEAYSDQEDEVENEEIVFEKILEKMMSDDASERVPKKSRMPAKMPAKKRIIGRRSQPVVSESETTDYHFEETDGSDLN